MWQKYLLKAAPYLIVFFIGMGIGIRVEQPKIANLNQQVGEYKSAYLSLAETSKEQNDAILKLQQDAADREKAVERLMAAAKEQAKAYHLLAQQILSQDAPAAPDDLLGLCKGAQKAFNDELKAERGQ